MRGFGVLILLTLLMSCSSTPETQAVNTEEQWPDWITQLPAKTNWVYGTGSAEWSDDPVQAAQLARDRARLDLQKSLSISVSGSTTMFLSDSNGDIDKDIQQKVRSEVKPVELQSVQVINTYTSDQQHRVFVLVGMDKTDELQVTTARLMEIEEPLRTWLADYSSNVIRQLQYNSDYLRVVEQRRQLLDKYRLLSGRIWSSDMDDQVQRIMASTRTLLDQVRIEIKEYQQNSALGHQVAQALAEYGYGSLITRDHGNLVLSIHSQENPSQKDGIYYQFLDADFELSASDNIVRAGAVSAKGVAGTEESATTKAMASLAKKLSAEILKYLLP